MADNSTAADIKILPLESNQAFDASNIYSSASWISIIQQQYGFEINLIFENDSYLFPVAKINDEMGKRLISIPFSDYCDLSQASVQALPVILEKIKTNYPDFKLKAKFNSLQERTSEYTVKQTAVYHKIDLRSDLPDFHKSFKRGVKKAEKEQLNYTESRSQESLESFYTLYAKLRVEKFDSIPQPKSFFRKVFDEFILSGKGHISEVRDGDQIVASAIVLYHKNIAYYKYGCSAIEALDKKPNNLLFYSLINNLHEKGFSELDLGSSGVGDEYAGLRRWKSQMGGKEFPIFKISTSDPEFDKTKTAFKSRINQLVSKAVEKDSTIEELDQLSENIYRYFA
jgi:hypothetical protein